ncbi:glutamate 5-kinase [Calidifontibacter sp. DB0510]|uniref:Glutamate 5-kinase n=1 Tax=Metallococcus carri TaxID=1656884 RepID=A0A967AWJ0_9MICO|nr:glutamate 5-kinase [Metallococcus carri]NHN54254.1 glutamate 5-kinase [Metallococcus carri]NOP36906.1 glutamate 5-kinase [Calidifontibacter sp. DB2511S]
MDHRDAIRAADPLVVKVGSSSLTRAGGGLDTALIDALADVLAARHAAGHRVVLVSSGAIAAGMTPLQLAKRPSDLATQQAAASVGQTALMAAYTAAFGRHGVLVGQVLLTSDDVTRRGHYTNARRTLERLFALGVVPIVNENDTVATHEIRFGDNDRLAALVAHLIGARALVLLSDVDALYDGPPSRPGARRIGFVPDAEDLGEIDISKRGSAVGTGGMITKVEAARIATGAGVTTVLTSADRAGDALSGQDVGTVFAPTQRARTARQLWLAHATAPQGGLVLDDGAVLAVTRRGKSLLPAGVREVRGKFSAGDAVDLVDLGGTVIARGLVNYDAHELPNLLGRSTRELARELGPEYERELVHRDDLVVLRRGK